MKRAFSKSKDARFFYRDGEEKYKKNATLEKIAFWFRALQRFMLRV